MHILQEYQCLISSYMLNNNEFIEDIGVRIVLDLPEANEDNFSKGLEFFTRKHYKVLNMHSIVLYQETLTESR